jgi:hypothetical protein
MIGESVFLVHTNYTFGDAYIDVFSTYDKAIDFMWKTLDENVYADLDDVTKNDYDKAKAERDSYYTDECNVVAWVEEYTVK